MEVYQELPALEKDGIRLLRIEPASDTSRGVRCNLEVVPLSDRPNYFALSYTWGPPYAEYCKHEKKEAESHQLKGEQSKAENNSDEYEAHETTGERIICNGKEIFVTRNLYDFLILCSQYPAGQTLHGRLWVDAICINQNNLMERSQQVNIMAEIYKAASCVMVWLGAEEDSTHLAFELIEALASVSPAERLKIVPHCVSGHSSSVLLSFEHWRALARFFERAWFNRAWIIQEVIFARQIEVRCGTHKVAWEDLTMVSQFLATSIWTTFFKDPGYVDSIHSAAARWHTIPARLAATKKTWSSVSSDGLLYALIRCRSSTCQDPRDKVYSQLRLGNAAIFPTYTVSIAEVFINAAKYILEHTDNLLLLTCVEGEEFQVVPGLPTWVPDWSVTKALGLRVTGYGSYTAAGARAREYRLKTAEGKHLLTLEATELDKIVETGQRKIDLRFLSTAHELWGMISRLDEAYFTGESREEVVWRTLMTNRESISPYPSILYPASKDLESSFRNWVLWRYAANPCIPSAFPICTSKNSILPSKEEILEVAKKCRETPDCLVSLAHQASPFDVHYSHAMLQRPFRTKKGFFGLGTQALCEGDSVWIVSGCRVPLIFRRLGNSSRHRLVGGSYVHGFMNGEALKNEGVEFQLVELE
jgi:hypothetical protein